MERRKFISALPLAAGGALALRSTDSAAQTQQPTNYVSVKAYGAVGDGVTDDTNAIQTAINASGTKSLFFPDGIYLISAALEIASQIEIIGAGTPSVTILQKTLSTAVFWINAGTHIYTGISISGLVLDSNAQGTSSASAIEQSVQSGGTVYDLAIRNIVVGPGFPGGIQLQSVYYGLIDNVVVSKVGPQNAGLTLRGLDTTSQIVNLRVQNLSVRSGNQGYGIYIGSYAQGLYFFMCLLESSGLATSIQIVNDLGAQRPPENLFFSQVICDSPANNGLVISECYSANFVDCWFASAVGPASNEAGYGVWVSSGNEIIFNACRILNNANDGARIDQGATFVRFVGCSVFSNGTSASNTYDGISFRPQTTDFEVTSCNFTRALTVPNQRYSVSVYAGASDRYIISNNLLGGSISGGLIDHGTGVNKVTGNNVSP